MKVGDCVDVVDEHGEPHKALVTIVHDGGKTEGGPWAINAVYVSSDPTKRDPYGHQVERMSSLAPKSEQTAPGGRFYYIPTE